MNLRDTAARVMRATRLNTDWFAETVTYRLANGDSAELAAHVRHSVSEIQQPDGSTEIVDQIRVELDRADLRWPPDYGDRIYLDGDEEAYLYRYQGRHTAASWKATFARRRRTAQGSGKARPGR